MPVRTDEQLKKHQAALLELLTVFDNICRRLGISYQLFAGTALGAVRHKGFIPWDDDLDIIMLRPEYERFLKEAPAEPESEKYFLQAEFSEHWPMFFSKLRKNGTACIERYVPRDELMHQGIYIDIFPCDSLSNAPIIGKLQFAASKAVIARSLAKRGYRTDSKIKKLALKLSCLVPQRRFAGSCAPKHTPVQSAFTASSALHRNTKRAYSQGNGWTKLSCCLLNPECFRFPPIMMSC